MPIHNPSDATRRSTRTLVQGSVVTAIIAVAGTITTMVTPETEFNSTFWLLFAMSCAQTVGTSVGSYVQRKREQSQEDSHAVTD